MKKIESNRFKTPTDQQISLIDYDPSYCGEYENKKDAKKQLKKDIKLLTKLQYRLYASNKQALLIVFQAMDAAGKDSSIKHVFSGINPQGCEVNSFKHPSVEELEHDYLWRHYKKLPDRGRIGIFNRSHYENVLISRVHPEFILAENIPGIHSIDDVNEAFWESRFQQINHFERTLTENGTRIVKFFLHISKEEQKKRFLDRINDIEKNWKISSADIEERGYWDDYQEAYAAAISKTSTAIAPWYIIPANHKWFSRLAIGNIIVEVLTQMDLKMPEMSENEKKIAEADQTKIRGSVKRYFNLFQ